MQPHCPPSVRCFPQLTILSTVPGPYCIRTENWKVLPSGECTRIVLPVSAAAYAVASAGCLQTILILSMQFLIHSTFVALLFPSSSWWIWIQAKSARLCYAVEFIALAADTKQLWRRSEATRLTVIVDLTDWLLTSVAFLLYRRRQRNSAENSLTLTAASLLYFLLGDHISYRVQTSDVGFGFTSCRVLQLLWWRHIDVTEDWVV